MIELDEATSRKVLATEMLYVHHAAVTEVTSQLKLSQFSLLIPAGPNGAYKFNQDKWWIEHYAGGMGGWSFAHNFFQPLMTQEIRRIALELELQFAAQYAPNHKTTVIGDLINMLTCLRILLCSMTLTC